MRTSSSSTGGEVAGITILGMPMAVAALQVARAALPEALLDHAIA